MGKCLFMRKGETHTAPLSGILASDIAIGSTVKLMENGSAVDYLVVNKGKPSGSSLYDDSCAGLWLLRKSIHSSRQWHTSNVNDYANSALHSYLNGEFFNSFGTVERAAIKQVKIPYRAGSGSDKTVTSGANGLACKVFLLSIHELSYSVGNQSTYDEGAELAYFAGCVDNGADSKRIAYLNGSAAHWWMRSPCTVVNGQVMYCYNTGSWDNNAASNTHGVRPALILPNTALFDEETMLLKGVA